MTIDEIIALVNQAGCKSYTPPPTRAVAGVSMTFAQLEDFVRLVQTEFMDKMIANPAIVRQIIDAGLLSSDPAGLKYRKKQT